MEPSRKLGAITLSLALLTGLSGTLLAWAAPNTIKGIELNSTPSSTEIILRSEARIPHRVIARSPEKIVIDLSSVDPTRSIQTDFASAENIEQVILKPLTSDKVRMVIRGEDLAPPTVTNTSGRARHHRSGASLVYQQESAPSRAPLAGEAPKPAAKIAAPAEDGFAMTATTAEAPAAPVTAEAPAAPESTNLEENFDLGDEDLAASETFNEQADADSENPPSERSFDRAPLVNTSLGENSITLDEPEATPLDHLNAMLGNISETLKQQFGGPEKGILFQIAGISGILIMLGLFIRSKMNAPESLYPEETFNPVAKPSLLEKIFGNKPRKGGRRTSKAANFGAPKPQQPAPRPQVNRGGELPIGLNRLGQQYPPQTAAANPMLQQSQAQRQYSQQSAAPVNQAPMRRDRSEIDRELKRSLNMRQAVSETQTKRPFQTPPQRPAAATRPATPSRPVGNPMPNRSPAAAAMAAQAPAPSRQVAPQPRAQQPAAGLPSNNNEVLEFLRNVAELMEKDGQANVAEGIKKGMMSRGQY